ncbi:MAG TPA: DUF1801 domain-containing protein [Ohtaekwangia sp.]|nr:DUF1801 domain-containing protein [Ohtaekwangia sp.]
MTVQNYILQQPSPHQEIMAILRSWILDLGPHTTEKISYTVPYFYFFGQVCYLHPDTDSVELCFAKGYRLSDEQKILQSKGRKQVRSIAFHSVAETEEWEHEVRQLLNEAAILNEYQFKKRKRTK